MPERLAEAAVRRRGAGERFVSQPTPSSYAEVDRRRALVARPDLTTRLAETQQSLRRHLCRVGVLADVIRALNAVVEPVRVAETLVSHAAGWIPASGCAVVAADADGAPRLLAEHGGPAVETVHLLASWVIRHGEVYASGNVQQDRRFAQGAPGAALAFPLICRGRPMGALVCLDTAPAAREPRLPAATLEAVQRVLEPAALALDSATRVERAEALSVTDDLTQLYNSRYLALVLRRETKRASRSGRPLSVLFIDLDGFKAINDAHGHLAGSRALVEAAVVIRGCARETDIVARFGGDEFSILLPDTGMEGAVAVAERVRERIAAHGFLDVEGIGIHLTGSVGIATLPEVATSAEALLQAADQAMYWVKDHGKNGIKVAEH